MRTDRGEGGVVRASDQTFMMASGLPTFESGESFDGGA